MCKSHLPILSYPGLSSCCQGRLKRPKAWWQWELSVQEPMRLWQCSKRFWDLPRRFCRLSHHFQSWTMSSPLSGMRPSSGFWPTFSRWSTFTPMLSKLWRNRSLWFLLVFRAMMRPHCIQIHLRMPIVSVWPRFALKMCCCQHEYKQTRTHVYTFFTHIFTYTLYTVHVFINVYSWFIPWYIDMHTLCLLCAFLECICLQHATTYLL